MARLELASVGGATPDAAAARGALRVLPPAGRARVRRRHVGVLFSFVLLVLAPAVATVAYLYGMASDQYASAVGFSVRKEEVDAAVDLLGGLGQLSGSSSSDTDILFEYIQSMELISRVDARLDLRRIYAKPAYDPVFAIPPDASVEDLARYWNRMVTVYYDRSTRLIALRVLAFDPDDAQAIAQAVVAESSDMINRLSAIAHADAMRYADAELDMAVDRLKRAREALTAFRNRTQIVDPSADVQGQMGLLSTLQQQLAEALIEMDLLSGTTRDGDPRLEQSLRRIEVIRDRIADERQKFGASGVAAGDGETDYASLVAEFERLSIDRVYAETAYTSALATLDAARAEARRQSRYLAAFIQPTLAETPEYPRRLLLGGMVALFLLLGWGIGVLVVYSLRDRR
jgi:capsular polysaccharide transport system permease protein